MFDMLGSFYGFEDRMWTYLPCDVFVEVGELKSRKLSVMQEKSAFKCSCLLHWMFQLFLHNSFKLAEKIDE